jgi:hypothetical protein
MLAEARSLTARYTPGEAVAADGILLVGVRSTDERREYGVIPIDGGFEAWVAAGLPVGLGLTEPTKRRCRLRRHRSSKHE